MKKETNNGEKKEDKKVKKTPDLFYKNPYMLIKNNDYKKQQKLIDKMNSET